MKLGVNQAALLRSLVENHSVEGESRWTPYCGWMWDSVLHTKKMLDALARRGLVKVTMEKNTEGWSLRSAEYPVYTPTDAGLAWVKANPR